MVYNGIVGLLNLHYLGSKRAQVYPCNICGLNLFLIKLLVTFYNVYLKSNIITIILISQLKKLLIITGIAELITSIVIIIFTKIVMNPKLSANSGRIYEHAQGRIVESSRIEGIKLP